MFSRLARLAAPDWRAGLERQDFSFARAKKALPVFLLLFAGSLLLAGLYLATIRSHFIEIERAETERLLESYLAAHRSPLRHFGSLLSRHDDLLEGLAFVRVVQGGDQMLLVAEPQGESILRSYIDLAPNATGVWLKVELGEKQRLLAVVARRYDSGIIQAGKDAGETFRLFRGLVGKTIGIVACGSLFLWLISLYFVKQSLGPLTASREMIADLERSQTGLLPEEGNGPELDRLYRQINRLIRQNRRLVLAMQQSLDNVAHDLRTPMTRLRSVAEFGLQADDDTARLREALADCLEESERVLAMLKIMMSVAEAESGTMRLEVRECDLAETLAQVITMFEYVAEERRITVRLTCDRPLPVQVDGTRIVQVWANLLDNAIKYGREGGWVTITGRMTTDGAEVVFADNGMGISASEQGKIWERLYRGDRSRSQQGLGLGLSYVRAVVLAHGGSVSVTSTLHEGSSFTVRLPLQGA